MKTIRLFALCLVLAASCFGQFTEFYANASTGSNMNGGSDAGAASYADVSGAWDGTSIYTIAGVSISACTEASPTECTSTAHTLVNGDTATIAGGTGNWTGINGLQTVTKTGANTFTFAVDASAYGAFAGTVVYRKTITGVAAGQFAHVFNPAAATTPAYVARVASNTATTITLSTTAFSGTLPGAVARSINVGGVWKGPNGAVNFPFSFVTAALTDSGGLTPRVNFKNNATYSTTALVTGSVAGPIRWQGYTTTVADGGRFLLDNGITSGGVLTLSGATQELVDAIIASSVTAGTTSRNLTISGSSSRVLRVVSHGARSDCFYVAGAAEIKESEAYNCNTGNTAPYSGFSFATIAGSSCIRCISHDSTGSNASGFYLGISVDIIDSVSDTNGGHGVLTIESGIRATISGLDAYNNGGDGIRLANTSASSFLIENSNLVNNRGWGINGSGAGARIGGIVNVGFGAGTMDNDSGTTTGLKSMVESSSVTYAAGVTPWTDPANGDFRINLVAAKAAGRGAFTQTAPSYAGTIGYPDIGAAKASSAAVGGGTRTY